MKSKSSTPWQISMFKRSLKKQQKLKALLDLLGDTRNKKCLLVTCGDNNGALNWHFREHGGNWTWGDISGENNDVIARLLGEPVLAMKQSDFQLPDEQFDCIVSIDCLEHLQHDQPILCEINRLLKPGSTAVVTVPNGDPRLLANQIKWKLGMTPEVYGHTRAGYTVKELSEAVQTAGLHPQRSGGYSRFFTEMVELVINFGYVRVLSKKSGGAQPGHIAPVSSGELKTHGLAYKIYGWVFPILRAVSLLDNLLSANTNNAVIVTAVKQENR
jgi:2-polyprenyl-3-methyl-5-hydroxy-6-metoxy-1,4-benzoquinol methylase